MTAKFLCCLSLRFGVIVISFIQFLFCGGFAGLLWWALWYGHKNNLAAVTQQMKTTVIIVASIYTAAALVGLLGFLGAILKKNGFVKTFYILLCTVFGLQVGSSIWYLVTFYRVRGQTVEQCIGGSKDVDKIALCQSMDAYRRVPQGALIASVIVPLLIQAYACYIVYKYSQRLSQQKADMKRSSAGFVTTGPIYQPVQPHDSEAYPLTQPNVTYPYADAPNSFGHSKQPSYGGGHDVHHKV
ncbi:hypothetical protein B0H34DRAFT_795703 [Crassisporium funariophilum]|nr:hypothetical protein B0H34DRAFT_795703 [Crassisporium funariophilum]